MEWKETAKVWRAEVGDGIDARVMSQSVANNNEAGVPYKLINLPLASLPRQYCEKFVHLLFDLAAPNRDDRENSDTRRDAMAVLIYMAPINSGIIDPMLSYTALIIISYPHRLCAWAPAFRSGSCNLFGGI